MSTVMERTALPSVVNRFMKKRVVDRVVLIPREKKADLLKYFPKASLPPHLGGSNTSISVSADAVQTLG